MVCETENQLYAPHSDGQFIDAKEPTHLSRDYTDQLQLEFERKRKRRRLTRPSYMQETHLGGRLENVPGFSHMSAMIDRQSMDFRTNMVLVNSPDNREAEAKQAVQEQQHFNPENVFSDGEAWVQVFETASVPWRSVCQLEITYQSGRTALGTGWFAGPSTIITAGHNIFSKDGDGWASPGIRIIPGRSGNIWPFGETHAKFIDTLAGWTSSLDPKYDLGVIKTADTKIGFRTGWFGMTVWNDQDFLSAPIVNNAGYPGISKPPGTQWFDASRILSHTSNFLHYRLDTEPGLSGAPIFYYDFNGQRLVVATHVYGSSNNNLGLRINSNIFKTISGWLDN